MIVSAEGNQAEPIILPIGQEYSIDLGYCQREEVFWKIVPQVFGKKNIIEVDVKETPIQTFWYHPDLAPALSNIHFTIRALSLGTAHLSISYSPKM